MRERELLKDETPLCKVDECSSLDLRHMSPVFAFYTGYKRFSYLKESNVSNQILMLTKFVTFYLELFTSVKASFWRNLAQSKCFTRASVPSNKFRVGDFESQTKFLVPFYQRTKQTIRKLTVENWTVGTYFHHPETSGAR